MSSWLTNDVLVSEDVYWRDAQMSEMLYHAVERLSDGRVMIILELRSCVPCICLVCNFFIYNPGVRVLWSHIASGACEAGVIVERANELITHVRGAAARALHSIHPRYLSRSAAWSLAEQSAETSLLDACHNTYAAWLLLHPTASMGAMLLADCSIFHIIDVMLRARLNFDLCVQACEQATREYEALVYADTCFASTLRRRCGLGLSTAVCWLCVSADAVWNESLSNILSY